VGAWGKWRRGKGGGEGRGGAVRLCAAHLTGQESMASMIVSGSSCPCACRLSTGEGGGMHAHLEGASALGLGGTASPRGSPP
jgi:hypothetical protein